MNKANFQRNFEVWLESIRNYLDHSLTYLSSTVLPNPYLAISSNKVREKQVLGHESGAEHPSL